MKDDFGNLDGWLRVWFFVIGAASLIGAIGVPILLVWVAFKLLYHFGVI